MGDAALVVGEDQTPTDKDMGLMGDPIRTGQIVLGSVCVQHEVLDYPAFISGGRGHGRYNAVDGNLRT